MSRITPQSAGARCGGCPFAKAGKPDRPVLAVGSPRPVAVVIAESPGSEEVERGEPLVGPTGREFDAVLESAGLPRNHLLILNALCCRPKQSRSEKDMHDAVNACRPYVAAVLDTVHDSTPMLIAGKWAFVSITGRTKGHGNERGFIQKDIRPSTARRTEAAGKSSAGGTVPEGDDSDDGGD